MDFVSSFIYKCQLSLVTTSLPLFIGKETKRIGWDDKVVDQSRECEHRNNFFDIKSKQDSNAQEKNLSTNL